MDQGLVCAYHISDDKPVRELTFEEVRKINKKPEGDGWYWIHLDCTKQSTRDWLGNYSGMLNSVAIALGSERSRPRCHVFQRGILAILRGINTNPGADPEDMVSVRIWMNDKIVITTRREKLRAIDDIRKNFDKSGGIGTPSELFMVLAESLIERMEDRIESIDTRLEQLEDTGDLLSLGNRRPDIFQIRNNTITLLRYITPQRSVINTLINSKSEFFDREEVGRLRIMLNKVQNNVEELEAIKERAIALGKAITGVQNEQMNKAMYLLAIVTALFLPIMLLTGLLGINVGGMPGAGWKPSFWIVFLAMGLIAAGTYKLMKSKNMV